MRLYWTEQEREKILNNKRGGETWAAFAKREIPYRTGVACFKYARKHFKIENKEAKGRKYFHNSQVWNTESLEACYWAGFLAADGCIIERAGGFSLKIELQESDKNILFNFLRFLDCNSLVFNSQKVSHHSGKVYSYSNIQINAGRNDQLILDLINKFNVTPRKTKTLRPPNLKTTEQKMSFIAGFFDGDACLQLQKTKYGHIPSIAVTCGSKIFLEWIFGETESLLENSYLRRVTQKKINQDRKGNNTFSIRGMSCAAFIDYIRQLPIPRMTRKWDKPKLLSYIEKQKSLYPDKFLIYSQNSI